MKIWSKSVTYVVTQQINEYANTHRGNRARNKQQQNI